MGTCPMCNFENGCGEDDHMSLCIDCINYEEENDMSHIIPKKFKTKTFVKIKKKKDKE